LCGAVHTSPVENGRETVTTEDGVTTLDASELDFEAPANELAAAVELRASLPQILAYRLSQLQALGHAPPRPAGDGPTDGAPRGVVIDARGRFARRA
jgi:hypothetical protein